MQSLIALSTTEAEYIALSAALWQVIAVIHLLEELESNGFPIHKNTPSINCTTFEDNQSCIALATSHHSRPQTKHLSVHLHHFCSWIVSKRVTIQHVSTKDQIVEIFTKPLLLPAFAKLWDRMMNWTPSKMQHSEGVRGN